LLTQQISTVFNHLIQNTNKNHQMLATQMGWIADISRTPNVPNQQIQQVANNHLSKKKKKSCE
jgi:hemoglobin-like flavoprotein